MFTKGGMTFVIFTDCKKLAKLYIIFTALLRFEHINAQMLRIMAALLLTWQVLLHLRIMDLVEVIPPTM